MRATYRTGHHVYVPVEGQPWPALIVDNTRWPHCRTCHCTPPNPDHQGNGTVCCPGTWYTVAFTWQAGGSSFEVKAVYAEHEITPRRTTRRSRKAFHSSHRQNVNSRPPEPVRPAPFAGPIKPHPNDDRRLPA